MVCNSSELRDLNKFIVDCEVRKDDECELKIVYIVNKLCFCNEIDTIHRSTVHYSFLLQFFSELLHTIQFITT